jgi:MFS family permease
LPVGVLLDRYGVRRVGRISTAIWSVASFAAALSGGIGGLFGARFLLGVGEAPSFPANAKAIGRWFPSRERSFATSIFDAAAKFASALGVPILGVLLLKVGWVELCRNWADQRILLSAFFEGVPRSAGRCVAA